MLLFLRTTAYRNGSRRPRCLSLRACDTAQVDVHHEALIKIKFTAVCDQIMETTNNVANESAKYLKGYRLYSLLVSLMLGTMLVAIDNTIIGVAVPKITTEFKALDDVGWYSSAYLIAVTALQPTYGKVYKHFDVKVIYLAAIIVFEGQSPRNIP